MRAAWMFMMFMVFVPPVIAVFVLISRMRSSRNESDARERLFAELCEMEREKKRTKKLSEDNESIVDEPEPEKVEENKAEENKVEENKAEEKIKNDEALDKVMDMFKSSKGATSKSELNDMISLLSKKKN